MLNANGKCHHNIKLFKAGALEPECEGTQFLRDDTFNWLNLFRVEMDGYQCQMY